MKKLLLSSMISLAPFIASPVFAMDDFEAGQKSQRIIQEKSSLPEGFVYLDEIDPSIQYSLRYNSENNFIGCPIDGYKASRVILTRPAANALSKAQAHFKTDGYSIVVYDATRPQTAVNHFMRWSKETSDQTMKSLFYPRIDKAKVFELGYVAEKSGHSRGSTVDISLLPLGAVLHEITPQSRKLKDFEFLYLKDGTVDMGGHFDLFDKASHYENDLISEEHQSRRKYIKDVMESYGFKNYAEEWWHFTLKDEPFPDTYHDFPIE